MKKSHAIAAVAAVSLVGASAQAAIIASDDSSNSAYNSSWLTGTGSTAISGSFGGGWTFNTSGSGGRFTGSSAGNGGSPNINVGGDAWGLWANSGGFSEASRPLNGALTPGPIVNGGQQLLLSLDNGGVNTGGTVGVSFQNASNQNLVEFYFRGGQSNYEVNRSGGAVATTIGFTTNGLNLVLGQAAGAGTFSLTITRLGTGGSTQTVTGSLLSPSGGQAISTVRFFNSNAGGGSGNDAFFNRIAVIPEPATLGVLAGAGLIALRRRK